MRRIVKRLLEQNELSDKIKTKKNLLWEVTEVTIQRRLREVIKVIRVHSQDEIEIEWNFVRYFF